SGGGGLLQDATSSKSLYYYLALIYYAQKLHKKTVVLAQGIGPIKHRLNLYLARRVLASVDLATVRDSYSFDIASGKIDKSKIAVTADLGFLFEDEESASLPFKDYTVFAPAKTRNTPTLDELVNIVYTISRKTGKNVLLMPLFGSFDGKLVEDISSITGMPLLLPSSIAQAAFIIRNAYMVVGTRYHSVVLSSAKNVPFIALSYDPKVTNLADEFGEKALPYGNLSLEKLEQSLEEVLCSYEDKKSQIQAKAKELKQRAKENFELLYSLLQTE
ncbi:MAG: polysaccharide pyruvyl transferase family protein, partial [Caldisericaceae bacterium]